MSDALRQRPASLLTALAAVLLLSGCSSLDYYRHLANGQLQLLNAREPIAERLKRPMRRLFGGKWVSMMGIPPLTLIFLLIMMPITLIKHRIERKRRRRRLASNANVNEAFIGSWF